MILDLKGVFDCEGYSRRVSCELDMSGFEDRPGEFPFKKPLAVEAFLQNRAGVVELGVSADAVFTAQCDRCLAPIEEKLGFSFDSVLVKKLADPNEDSDLVVVEDEKFDLDEYVRTNVILELPMKHLCKPDCRGLCPVCGKNLNEGECGCHRGGDSAFSVLESLKDK